MNIREYRASDFSKVVQLFQQTVHSVNANDYTPQQLEAWTNIDMELWQQSLELGYTIVAEQTGIILGFGDIRGGYLDRLYVHKDWQNMGIGSSILAKLEDYAFTHGESSITTYSSVTAHAFFESHGFTLLHSQQVTRHSITLTNFVMQLHIENASST